MRRTGLLLVAVAALCAGCGRWNDYLVHYEMRSPHCPTDPNELLARLQRELPADVEIEYFMYRPKPEAMRGIVLVSSRKAGRAVLEAVRRDPQLFSVMGELQEAYAGEHMICLCSQPPFMPETDTEIVELLQKDLPSGIKISIDGSRRKADGIVIWATVWGNFGKEAVEFAGRHNENVKVLQVEDSTLFTRLLCRWRIGRVQTEE